jgi:hypothetical protein
MVTFLIWQPEEKHWENGWWYNTPPDREEQPTVELDVSDRFVYDRQSYYP